eukprot:TRINITY_DN10151_c0_g1_i1.p1 TRINITY_DN10151_c0_g1~~TRINITY_DN10151_c0_g1_i1.p1  ORF type:complete len:621 (-),score=63.69 TRINITY_DN10151_c0_g1_i1:59-1921(-)
MVASSASTLGRPVGENVTEVTIINNSDSAVADSRWVCGVGATSALAIMMVEASLLALVDWKPECEYEIAGKLTARFDVITGLSADLLSPWCSGALLVAFVANRHRYVASSHLHFWTFCYALAAFASSWLGLLSMMNRCSSEELMSQWWVGKCSSGLVALTHGLISCLSIVKIRCLSRVAPVLARVGEIGGKTLVGAVSLIMIWEQMIFEFHIDFLANFIFGVLIVVAMVAMVMFFGSLIMLLSFSANCALKEASQNDIDDNTARLYTDSARWTRFTLVATAASGTASVTIWISGIHVTMAPSSQAVMIYQWVTTVDMLTNVVAYALLSGILGNDSAQRRCSKFLRVAQRTTSAQKRRKIEGDLTSLVGAARGSALTVATMMDGMAPADLLLQAQSRFRCISWEDLAASPEIIIGGGPLDVVGPGGNDLYSMSQPCGLGDCDAFVSHSWHDNGLQKWEALRSWCDDFFQSEGRHPRLWIDKLCICQGDIVNDLRSLPVFIAGCHRLLIISGSTYPTRLWCSMEVLVHRSLLASDPSRPSPEILFIGDDEDRMQHQQRWCNFDVAECQCFSPKDKRRFLRVVESYPGGSEGFNQFIRTIAADLTASSEVTAPKRGYDFTERC